MSLDDQLTHFSKKQLAGTEEGLMEKFFIQNLLVTVNIHTLKYRLMNRNPVAILYLEFGTAVRCFQYTFPDNAIWIDHVGVC